MKKIVGMLAALGVAAAMPLTAWASAWQQTNGRWWYQMDGGKYPVNGWMWIDGDRNGIAECYYFDQNGWLLTDTTTPDGYQVNADGQWITYGQIRRVYSTAAYIIAAGVALVLSMLPKFGALIATIPPGVLGGAGTVLYGMIGMLGVRIWVQNRVDFSNPVNLNTAAVSLIVAIANFTWVVGDMTFGGIALGTAAALLIYHGMRLISKLRGTNLEAATPASAPSGSELEGEAYSKRHRSPAPQADA